jgi:ABC-type iron transport system FetAB ATPase subunit
VSDELLALLGESLLHGPSCGSRLLRRREYHRLVTITGGSVYLRGEDWTITPAQAMRGWVSITLRKG